MINSAVVVVCNEAEQAESAKYFATANQFTFATDFNHKLNESDESINSLALVFEKSKVSLHSLSDPTVGEVVVDFVTGKLAYRRRQQSFHSDLAKAIGVLSKIKPVVWDVTAGFGSDGFALANLGCKLKLIERNPVVHCLLEDGLQRAKSYADLNNDSELVDILSRIELLNVDSKTFLQGQVIEKPDVIYIDPMFPERSKSAKVKKGMQFFHQLVGADNDSTALIDLALQCALYRVVVKRPLQAGLLSERVPNHQIKGKTVRFDVYTLKAIKTLASD